MLSLAGSSRMLRKVRTPIDHPTVNTNAAAQPGGGVRYKTSWYWEQPKPSNGLLYQGRNLNDAHVRCGV
jgi:hypothetical protein